MELLEPHLFGPGLGMHYSNIRTVGTAYFVHDLLLLIYTTLLKITVSVHVRIRYVFINFMMLHTDVHLACKKMFSLASSLARLDWLFVCLYIRYSGLLQEL